MAKVTAVLWRGKKNAQGLCPIYLRLEADGRRQYLSLGVRVRESQWNERTSRVRKSHKNHQRINSLVAKKVAEGESRILELKAAKTRVTPELLKVELNAGETSGGFFGFASGVVDELEHRGQIHTHKRYKSIVGKFRTFARPSLAFDQITPSLLRRFETHLIKHHGNNPGTVKTNFNCIRAIYYRAVREGLVSQASNPFFDFKPSRSPSPERDKLSYEQIQAIEALGLEPDSLTWHVRNYFLFSFYCAGIRFGDLARLRWENVVDGRLEYTMGKTSTRKSIKLLKQALAILKHYRDADANPDDFVFPMLYGYDLSDARKLANAVSSQNALVNKYLKKIAALAGIQERVSFHVSRHSFADYARKEGVGLYDISKMLGHRNIKVTEAYLKGFDQESMDAEMERLFG